MKKPVEVPMTRKAMLEHLEQAVAWGKHQQEKKQ